MVSSRKTAGIVAQPEDAPAAVFVLTRAIKL
jgi:hypothetical protein